ELRPVAAQAERRDLPERRGAAVAEDDLVAVGQREQLGEPAAQPGHLVADGLLAVRGAEVRGGDAGQRVHGLPTHLARAGAEAAVGGLDLVRDADDGETPSRR